MAKFELFSTEFLIFEGPRQPKNCEKEVFGEKQPKEAEKRAKIIRFLAKTAEKLPKREDS